MKRNLLLVLFVFLLSSMAFSQKAYRLARKTDIVKLNIETFANFGASIPMNSFKASSNEESLPQGASLGGLANIGAKVYFIPYFGMSFSFLGEWHSYDNEAAVVYLNQTIQGKASYTGWEFYSLGVDFHGRVPLFEHRMYLTARVGINGGLRITPGVKDIVITEIIVNEGTEDEKTEKDKTTHTIIGRKIDPNIFISGGIGFQYRIIDNVLLNINLDYNKSVIDAKNGFVDLEGQSNLIKSYSAMTFSIGVSYAFEAKK